MSIRGFFSEQDDQSRWHLTRLGKLVALTAAGLLAAGLSMLLIPDRQSAADRPAVKATADPKQTARILTTADALDFTVVAYGDYIQSINAEAAATKQLEPPFDLTVMLRRVEYIRPKLSPSLYQKLRATYLNAAKVGPITRDELLCGKPDATGIRPSLKLAGREVASVSVDKYIGEKVVGSFTVTVDLKGRALSEISCP